MTIIITEEAQQRLEKELEFLIEERGIPVSVALSLGKKLLKKANSLSEQPYIGQEELQLESLNQGHRRLIEGEFKIIYLIISDKVYVTNFFNTRRDPETMKG